MAHPGRLLGPTAGMLLTAAGTLSIFVTLTLPILPETNTDVIVWNGIAAILLGLLVWRMPWRRWPESWSHVIAIVSFGLIAIGDWGTGGSYRYNLFYVAVFTWIGLLHRRGTSLRFVPVVAFFYLAPSILRGDSLGAVATPFTYTLAICLLVGETISWLSSKLRELERDLAVQRSSERFGSLVDYLSDIIAIIDTDSRLRFASSSISQVLGYPADRILGRNALACIHPDDRQRFKEFMSSLLNGSSRSVSGELRLRHIDGDYRILEVLAINELANEHIQGLLFTGRDITTRKMTETRLREAEERHRSLIEQLPAMTYIEVVTGNPAMRVMPWVSPQSEEMFGYTAEEWAQGFDYAREFVHSDDFLRVQDQTLVSAETLEPFDSEYRVITRDGSVTWVRDYARIICDADGSPLYWQGIMFDISAQKELESRLEHLAFYDQLTGLPNRTLLLRELEQRSRIDGSVNDSISLLLLNLDNFKLINDSFGQAVGDQVIAIAAQRLQQMIGHTNLVAHFGGDEFVILLTGSSAAVVSAEIARRTFEVLRPPMHIDGQEIRVTASIGIAHSRCGELPPDALLRNADIAMYEARSTGQNRYVMFDASMQDRAVERLVLESDLRRAIDEEQFELYFQPILDLQTGKITKVEALLRWQHPRRGLLSPNEFISVAEETGLILKIGHLALVEACRLAREWQQMFGEAEAPIVAINLSPQQFLVSSLSAEVRQVLDQPGLSPGKIELEITEHAAMGSPDMVIETLQELKSLGVRIALDDFGTGYSGLSYLTRFPIDTLKIDRSFVAGMHDSPADLAIVRTILAFSTSLGLETVAEGIDMPSQQEQLLELGCDYGQGFYFTRPVPAEMVPDLLVPQLSTAEEIRHLPIAAAIAH